MRSIAPLLAPGTRIAGRYEVVAARGVGGWAIVYEAKDLELGRVIALKLLRSDRATDVAIRRLRREVALARQIESPHIVRVFDIGESEHGYFVTMELVDGETLRTVIERGPIPADETIRIADVLLQALQALHDKGVVHRDVKPSNVLIDREGRVKLADFGLALQPEADESRATATDAVIGTIEYLAPEQALGKVVDQRSDLYGLGVVLFEMATGRLPFIRTSSLANVIARLSETPPEPSRFNRDIPRWLSRFVARLLERDPRARYATAADALRDLRRRRVVRRLKFRVSAVILILAAAFGIWSAQSLPQRHFSHLVMEGDGRGRAVAADGRTLWTIYNPAARATVFHTAKGGAFVGAILGPVFVSPSQRQVLTILDADTGKTVDRVVMPDAHHLFSEFSNDYQVGGMKAVDLDGDGNDEILITYAHNPYYPSYLVWYDVASKQSRVIFVASGHHVVVGAADVNGDGRKDLLLTGINNRMGWYASLAAIDVPRDYREPLSVPVASSPDTLRSYGVQDALLWYSLLPIHYPVHDRVNIDAPRRTIEITYGGGRTIRVGFDGFIEPSRASANDRNGARTQAYMALREAERISASSGPGRSAQLVQDARDHALAAGDAILSEWCERVYGALLINDGKFAEADQLFLRILHSSNARADVAWEAAVAWHRRGDFQRAVDWYRRGWGEYNEGGSGRPRVEFLQGEVLALGELGRWTEALRTIHGHGVSHDLGPNAVSMFDNYVRWRTNESLLPYKPLGQSTTDLPRYWDLEFRLTNGEDPRQLLRSIEREMSERNLQDSPLLLSVRAAALQRIDRHDDALLTIRRAFERAQIEQRSDPIIHAHYGMVKQRFDQITRAGS